MVAVEIEETEAAADAIAGSFLSSTSQKVATGRVAIFFRMYVELRVTSPFPPRFRFIIPLPPYRLTVLACYLLLLGPKSGNPTRCHFFQDVVELRVISPFL